jgi:predicted transcriptional regulator
MTENSDLVNLFKALADSSRLKIVGLLAQQAYSVEELAALLNLKPATVSHHLAKLAKAGLVSAKAEGYYSMYSLNQQALEDAARRAFSAEQTAATLQDVDLDAYDHKVLADFSLPDGRLKIIPAQRKKLDAILRHLARQFEPGARYPEARVNEILARFHADTATLRRELVGSGLMTRENGVYWLK